MPGSWDHSTGLVFVPSKGRQMLVPIGTHMYLHVLCVLLFILFFGKNYLKKYIYDNLLKIHTKKITGNIVVVSYAGRMKEVKA